MSDIVTKDLETAKIFLKSGYLPSYYQTPEQVVVVMAKGRELDINPLHALYNIFMIDNVPALRGELMNFLIRRKFPNAPISFDFSNKDTVIVHAARTKGDDLQSFDWNLERAKHLLHKKCWREYPRAMLTWRAFSEMARLVFPDALQGCSYTPEELGKETTSLGVPLDCLPNNSTEGTMNATDRKDASIEVTPVQDPHVSEKLEKLVQVMTSNAVGFSLEDLEALLAFPRKKWDETHLKALEGVVRLLKRTNTPQQNKQLAYSYLEDL